MLYLSDQFPEHWDGCFRQFCPMLYNFLSQERMCQLPHMAIAIQIWEYSCKLKYLNDFFILMFLCIQPKLLFLLFLPLFLFFCSFIINSIIYMNNINWFPIMCQSTTFLDLFNLYHEQLPHPYISSPIQHILHQITIYYEPSALPFNNNIKHLCDTHCVPGIILST